MSSQSNHTSHFTHHVSRIPALSRSPERSEGAAEGTHHAFSLSIAGISVMVACDDASLADVLCQRYRAFPSNGEVHLVAHVHLAGRLRESALLDTGTAFHDGLLHFTAPGYEGFINEESGEARLALSSAWPVEDVDYFLRVAYAILAFRAGGLLFHAAGIVRHGRGYLFFGPSGSGKTTVARLSPDDLVLNDDLVLLMPGEEGWTAHATPFWNQALALTPSPPSPLPLSRVRQRRRGEQRGGGEGAPLAAMFRLIQDRAVYREAMGQGQALAEVVASVPVISGDPARSGELLERGRCLLEAVPAYRLHFLPEPSFWSVIEAQRNWK